VTGKMEEAIDHFLVIKEKTSHFHSNDLTRRLKKWADTIDLTQPIYSFTKQEIGSYLARYSAQNFINHRAALSNLFGHALKIGATPENPVSGIEKRFDVLSRLVLGGLVGLRPYEVLRLEWNGIHFQTREIRIEPGWTKTHRARVIPLQANALGWLRLIAAHTKEKAGRVMPSESTWNNRWQRWRQEEDAPLPLTWWVGKDDILRHS
jgi:integrase